MKSNLRCKSDSLAASDARFPHPLSGVARNSTSVAEPSTELRADRIDIQSGSRGAAAEFTLDPIQPRIRFKCPACKRDRLAPGARYAVHR